MTTEISVMYGSEKVKVIMCYKAHTLAVISVSACYDEITVINAPNRGINHCDLILTGR